MDGAGLTSSRGVGVGTGVPGPAPGLRTRVLLVGTMLLVAALLAGALLGPARVSPAGLAAKLADAFGLAPLPSEHARDAAVIGVVRAPCVLLGAVLDPGLATAGAALAAAAALVLGPAWFGVAGGALRLWLLPLAAFAGGLAATALVARLAARECAVAVAVATLLLAGVAVNALCGALTGLLVFLADDRQVRDITFWTLGSLAGARWAHLPAAAALVLLPTLALGLLARPLNALALGEREAFHLGLRVEAAKRTAVALAAVAVAAGVAFAGPIGFVGLVVPHLVRLGFGADHQLVLTRGGAAGRCADRAGGSRSAEPGGAGGAAGGRGDGADRSAFLPVAAAPARRDGACSVIDARRITVRAGGRALLRDVSVGLRAGELLAVVGPNGAGKSTLLRALAGELRPAAGTIAVAGRPVRDWTPLGLARRRAVVSQSVALAFPMAVADVVALGRLP